MGMLKGRPYVAKFAYEVEVGEWVWVMGYDPVKQEEQWELWPVRQIQESGTFLLFIGEKGSVMHAKDSGVYVDIKKGQ